MTSRVVARGRGNNDDDSDSGDLTHVCPAPETAVARRPAGIYSPNAYRGFAREFIKDLERMRPRAILDIITSGENFRISTTTRMPEQGTCDRCGYISSQKLCKACVLLDGLNRGLPKLGIGRTKGSAGADSDGEQRAKRSERNGSSLQGKHGNFDF